MNETKKITSGTVLAGFIMLCAVLYGLYIFAIAKNPGIVLDEALLEPPLQSASEMTARPE
jgi:hypothetical protein